jgi:periplasmic protein TonB
MDKARLKKLNKSKALGVTLLFHGLLLALFFMVVFQNPDPPLFADNSGVEVNFGNSEEGMGEEQPDKLTSPAPKTPPPPQPREQVLTQNTEESPVTAKETLAEKIKEPVKQPPPPEEKPREEIKQPVVNSNALYKGKKSTSTSSGSEGETGKPGDQGIENGSLYSKKHGNTMGQGDHGEGDGAEGKGGKGKGVSFSLTGRKLVKTPEIIDRSQETGKVVVAITVDKNGTVTKAVPGARGSTTTSAALYAKAQQAALRARFNANPDASEEQRGTITFVFILQ